MAEDEAIPGLALQQRREPRKKRKSSACRPFQQA